MQGRLNVLLPSWTSPESTAKRSAQVVIRWDLQHRYRHHTCRCTRPLRSNADVFDFELSEQTWPPSTRWTAGTVSARTWTTFSPAVSLLNWRYGRKPPARHYFDFAAPFPLLLRYSWY